MLKLLKALLFLKSGRDIQVLAFVELTVEFFDGFSSAAGSVLNIVFVFSGKADEVKGLGWVFYTGASVEGGDVSVDAKKLLDVVVGHVGGQVLYEDVVEHFSLVGSAFGGKLDTDKAFFVALFLKGLLGVLSILETYKAVATG